MNQTEAEKKMLDAWADFVKESELPPGNFPSPALGRAWIRSIIAAIEEKAEADAQIVEHNRFKEPGEVADMIRARSNTPPAEEKAK